MPEEPIGGRMYCVEADGAAAYERLQGGDGLRSLCAH
jgi:hypothetical protein